MKISKVELKRELTILIHYLVISLIAAIWAFYAFHSVNYRYPGDGVEINGIGIIRVMWDIYLFPFTCAFFILSSLRLLYLLFFVKRSETNGTVNS